MSLPALLTLFAAAVQSGLALLVLWRSPHQAAHRSFCGGMGVLAAELVCQLFAGETTTGPWRFSTFLTAALLPAPWLVFSLSYGRAGAAQALQRHSLALILTAVVPPALVLGFPHLLLAASAGDPSGAPVPLRLGPVGQALKIFGVLAGILVLTNLERTVRDSVGIMRWRLKYLVLGLAVLLGFRLYLVSQTILYSALHPHMLPAQAGVTLLACALMMVALRRERVFEVDVYASPTLLFHSATVLVAGSYLLLVGLLAKAIEWVGGSAALPLQAFLIMVALVGLAVALLSERLRRRFQLFVSRHLRRPTHDYQRVWVTFTAATASQVDEAAYGRAVANWIAGTFRLLSVNLWVLEEDREEFRLGGSTVLTAPSGGGPTPSTRLGPEGSAWGPMVAALTAATEPVNLDTSPAPWAPALREANPGMFPNGGDRWAVPLTAQGSLIGLLVLGDRVEGIPFTTEDLDLLRCAGEQIAAGLLNLNLSRRLVRAKEFEAFQTMSAFFVHDLKNTTSTLSLTLQNLAQHFGNPDFREDALRAIGKSVQHLEGLISKLTLLRAELAIHPVRADLTRLVAQVVAGAGAAPDIELQVDLPPEWPATFDPDQFGKVVLNLLLNARDAVGARGSIRISGRTDGAWVELAVSDTGCGMSPEFIRQSLFRPFRTTKQRGIGIGMFQSKLIVDAHGGRIQVESQAGKGTTFRIRLPNPSPAPSPTP